MTKGGAAQSRARKGRPRAVKSPPGEPAILRVGNFIDAETLHKIAKQSGLKIIADEKTTRLSASFINQATTDFAHARVAQEADDPPGARQEWCAGVAEACRRLTVAFGEEGSRFRHRVHSHLKAGIPPDSGGTRVAFREMRLFLMRGFGPDWRQHLDSNSEPNVSELLYLGVPRFVDFARALRMIAEHAENHWGSLVKRPGGSRRDRLRINNTMRLAAQYRRLFGIIPTVSFTYRPEIDPERDTVPGGPALEWFRLVLLHVEGVEYTRDKIAHWIGKGVKELLAYDNGGNADHS